MLSPNKIEYMITKQRKNLIEQTEKYICSKHYRDLCENCKKMIDSLMKKFIRLSTRKKINVLYQHENGGNIL